MKYVIILSIVLAAAVAGAENEFLEKIIKMSEECSKEVGATGDDIEALVEHKVPATHEGKCIISCVHKKLGMQNADGKMDLAGGLAAIEPMKEKHPEVYEKVKEVFEKCAKEVAEDADECITGVNMMECGKKVGKEIGLTKEMFHV